MSVIVWAAITRHHGLRGVRLQKFISHSSAGWNV